MEQGGAALDIRVGEGKRCAARTDEQNVGVLLHGSGIQGTQIRRCKCERTHAHSQPVQDLQTQLHAFANGVDQGYQEDGRHIRRDLTLHEDMGEAEREGTVRSGIDGIDDGA